MAKIQKKYENIKRGLSFSDFIFFVEDTVGGLLKGRQYRILLLFIALKYFLDFSHFFQKIVSIFSVYTKVHL